MDPSAYHPNERPNFVSVDFGDLTIWFSYRTPIAFHYYDEEGGRSLWVCENDWGPTTSKHLNIIDGGNIHKRVSVKVFMRKLSEFHIIRELPLTPREIAKAKRKLLKNAKELEHE